MQVVSCILFVVRLRRVQFKREVRGRITMFNRPVSRRSFLTVSATTAATLALDWSRITAYAAKMGPKSDYPTVVIGAGLGGLVCGAYLAKQGVPVTVVEQHNIPGGYATSFDRAGGKFNFEVSLHGTSIHNNGAARILSDIGVMDRLKGCIWPVPGAIRAADMPVSSGEDKVPFWR